MSDRRSVNSQEPIITIGGFETVRLTKSELAARMVQDCKENRSPNSEKSPKLVFSSNGQGIALAGRDPSFLQTMQLADIIHADGMPVVLASRMTRAPLPDRIATTDFFHDAARSAVEAGLSFYFLGASEQENQKAVAKVRELYPDLRIAGRHHGYFSKEDNAAVVADIKASMPDVLWVALGKPRQEEWCVEVRELLPEVGWLKTCGGLFAFLSGDVSRAPRWMRSAGLEWLYRAANEPKRLLVRYLTTNPYAMWRLIRHTDWRRTPNFKV